MESVRCKTMQNEMVFIRGIRTAAILATALWLGACGGGGGGGGGDNSGPPATTDDTQSNVSGRLWHNNYALDYREGAQIASLSGALPVQVTPKLLAWPWPDGSQYATTDSDTDNTVLKVHALADGALLYTRTVEGYLRDVRPSPLSKSVILATWGDDSIAPAYAVFYDLAQQQVLDDFALEDSFVDWLPDGRYLRVSSTGTLQTGVVGGALTSTGSVVPPDQREIIDVDVSPDGSQMLLRCIVRAVDGGINESDLWIANTDGSNLRQFTNTGISSYGHWSPDSSQIAFNADTGVICPGYSCAGTCEIWHAKATAQALDALTENEVQAKFRVKDRQNRSTVLGCTLQGWTL